MNQHHYNAVGMAFMAGLLFAVSCALIAWSLGLIRSGQPQPHRRLKVMEIVRAGRRRIFALALVPAIARLDEQDAPITVESSDPAVVSAELLPFEEGQPRKVRVRTLAPGTATVTVGADADLDPGETRTLLATLDFEVTESGVEAQSIALAGEGDWEDDLEAPPTAEGA